MDRNTAYVIAGQLIQDNETALTIADVEAMSDPDLREWLGSFGYA